MKKHNSSQNVAHSKYKNVFGEEPIDLWSFNEPSMIKKSHNNKDNHFEKFVNRSKATNRYKPQLSLPNSNKVNEKKIIRTRSVERTTPSYKITNSSSSLPKKVNTKPKRTNNINVSISDYKNPDKVVKYIKNKCNEKNITQHQPQKKVSKQKNKKIEEISNNLYNKKTLSIDYELQRKIKQMKDEAQMKQELSECTFKPKLYTNNNNMNFKKINNEENNLYDQQNKWLNAVNEKKEKNFEKKMNKELEGCSFNPKITKMPNFNATNIVNKNAVERGLYYSKIRNAKRQSAEKQKRNEKDFAKIYDERKKKEKEALTNVFTVNQLNVNHYSDSNSKSQLSNQKMSNPQSEKQMDVVVDADFEMKKEQLMKELHNWKNEDETGSEEQDDFFD